MDSPLSRVDQTSIGSSLFALAQAMEQAKISEKFVYLAGKIAKMSVLQQLSLDLPLLNTVKGFESPQRRIQFNDTALQFKDTMQFNDTMKDDTADDERVAIQKYSCERRRSNPR